MARDGLYSPNDSEGKRAQLLNDFTNGYADIGDIPVSIVNITTNTTITPAHNAKLLVVTSGGNVTLTLPAEAPEGFTFAVDQAGAGKAIFAVAGAATKNNYSGYDRTAGINARMSVTVRSNAAGNNAVYNLDGLGATS